MCGIACLCVMHTEKGADEETYVYMVHSSYSLHLPVHPGFICLLEKIAPSCRLSTSAFFLLSCCFRQTTQDAPEEVRNRDFRRELEERERVAAREKNRDRPTRGKRKKKQKILVLLCGIAYAQNSMLQEVCRLQTACHECRI